MTLNSFSKRYKTYEEWRQANTNDSTYARRIAAAHERCPWATLRQLRGHPGGHDLPLGTLKPRECTPEALNDFRHMAQEFALVNKIFDYDNHGSVKRWRRPRDEP